jgi:hypothetical protein
MQSWLLLLDLWSTSPAPALFTPPESCELAHSENEELELLISGKKNQNEISRYYHRLNEMKGRSDTLRQIDGSLSVHDCCSRYFKLWNLASDLTTNARPVLSLLTGKDSAKCLWSVMLESKPSAEESLISIMISYYWSNVDNGFQTNASSFLAAA